MIRIVYNELKNEIHSQGLTIKLVAAYMHISPSTFRYRFSKGEVDSDDVQHLWDCVKMALEDKRIWG